MPPYDWTGLSDRELLIHIATKVEDLDHTVNGNGRPGLNETVAAMEARMDSIETSVPSKKEKWGVFTALVATMAAVTARFFGFAS